MNKDIKIRTKYHESDYMPKEKIYYFEDENYSISISFFVDPNTGEPVLDLGHACGISPISKYRRGVRMVDIVNGADRTGLPSVYGVRFVPIEILRDSTTEIRQQRIGYSVFDAIPQHFINEKSDPKFQTAKKFLFDVDEILREMFPGYGIVYGDGDPRDPDQKVMERHLAMQEWYDAYFEKYNEGKEFPEADE